MCLDISHRLWDINNSFLQASVVCHFQIDHIAVRSLLSLALDMTNGEQRDFRWNALSCIQLKRTNAGTIPNIEPHINPFPVLHEGLKKNHRKL